MELGWDGFDRAKLDMLILIRIPFSFHGYVRDRSVPKTGRGPCNQWRSQDERATRALVVWKKNLGYVAIRKGSRSIFMHFSIVFELDSSLFLAAAAVEGARQSYK